MGAPLILIGVSMVMESMADATVDKREEKREREISRWSEKRE